jgi:hypothetical protein
MALVLAPFWRAEASRQRLIPGLRIRAGRSVHGGRLTPKVNGQPFSQVLVELANRAQVDVDERGFSLRYDDERLLAFNAGVPGHQVARPVLGIDRRDRGAILARAAREVARQVQRDLRRA